MPDRLAVDGLDVAITVTSPDYDLVIAVLEELARPFALVVRGFAAQLAFDGIAGFEVWPVIVRADMMAGVSSSDDEPIGPAPAKRRRDADTTTAVVAPPCFEMALSTGPAVNSDSGLMEP